MEEFVNFLLHYYREIILGISIVLEIVILLFKKHKVKVSPGIYQDVIDFVISAEKDPKYKTGSEKLAYVIRCVHDKMNLEGDQPALDFIVKCIVEDVLSAPTKKGGLGRDEETD